MRTHLAANIEYFNNYENTSSYSQLELASCTLKHHRLLKHPGKRSSIKLQEFAKLCMLLLDKKLHDLIFMEHLAVDLGFNDATELINFINIIPSTQKRGRSLRSVAERQLMYSF